MPRRRAFTPAGLGAVVLGGAIGAALRVLALTPFQGADDVLVVPAATLVVNVVGSFLLGMLVGALDDTRPLTRAFFGTGMLGGFTTYSAFAVQVAVIGASAPVVGIALAVVAAFAGVLAAALGLRIGRARHPSDVIPPEASE